MKRAKLTQLPVSRQGTPDLTDRLLDREGAAKASPPAKGRAKAKAAPSRKSPAPTAGTDASQKPPKAEPIAPPVARRGPALEPWAAQAALPNETPEALRSALADTDKAVAALVKAAGDVPARHDLAVRYRLDALAHHLRQVREFLAARKK